MFLHGLKMWGKCKLHVASKRMFLDIKTHHSAGPLQRGSTKMRHLTNEEFAGTQWAPGNEEHWLFTWFYCTVYGHHLLWTEAFMMRTVSVFLIHRANKNNRCNKALILALLCSYFHFQAGFKSHWHRDQVHLFTMINSGPGGIPQAWCVFLKIVLNAPKSRVDPCHIGTGITDDCTLLCPVGTDLNIKLFFSLSLEI